MSKITVLGLGAMGSRMAANLLKAGHTLTVWNRTPQAAATLVEAGARQAATPRAAVAGADFVLAMLRDDSASRQVWLDAEHGALAGMAAGSIAIESSTVTPGWIRELGVQAAGQGVELLEAPVAGSRPQAEAGLLIFLAGGEAATLERCQPLLKAMGGAVHLVGPLGNGALTKLSTNALLGIQVTALAEVIGLLKRNGADVDAALKAIAATPVWAPVNNYLVSTMLTGNFAPQFPITLIEKDFGYAVAAAGDGDTIPTITAAHGVFQQAIEQGLGEINMSGVVQLFAK